ncbi:MAG: peptide-methionine (S)-S-oxide reductase MsrA [Gemmata sp.]
MHPKLMWLVPLVFAVAVGALLLPLVSSPAPVPEPFPVLAPDEVGPATVSGPELATFGSGCFWCTEAVFLQVKGVLSVESGYSGGHVPNPSYKWVCTGRTGHAEVVQVTFDPAAVSYPELLEVFWRSHDPTTRNRQGNDVGPQYRSVIFFHSDKQKETAERYRAKIDEAQVFRAPVVTEITKFEAFYKADHEHQNYYANNPRAGYCRAIIGPKVEKLKKVFGDRVKGAN